MLGGRPVTRLLSVFVPIEIPERAGGDGVSVPLGSTVLRGAGAANYRIDK